MFKRFFKKKHHYQTNGNKKNISAYAQRFILEDRLVFDAALPVAIGDAFDFQAELTPTPQVDEVITPNLAGQITDIFNPLDNATTASESDEYKVINDGQVTITVKGGVGATITRTFSVIKDDVIRYVMAASSIDTTRTDGTDGTTTEIYINNNVVMVADDSTSAASSIVIDFLRDTDGDGVVDYMDIDDDNDGMLDTDEGLSFSTLNPDPSSERYLNSGAHSNTTHNSPQLDSTRGWVSANGTDPNQFVGMLFDGEYGISSVTTKGRGDFNQWVTSYQLEATKNGTDWVSLGVFSGNTDRNTPVINLVPNSDTDWLGLRINPLEKISGNFGLRFGFELISTIDTDGDGVANHLDLDSDNDGISDLTGSGLTNLPHNATDADDTFVPLTDSTQSFDTHLPNPGNFSSTLVSNKTPTTSTDPNLNILHDDEEHEEEHHEHHEEHEEHEEHDDSEEHIGQHIRSHTSTTNPLHINVSSAEDLGTIMGVVRSHTEETNASASIATYSSKIRLDKAPTARNKLSQSENNDNSDGHDKDEENIEIANTEKGENAIVENQANEILEGDAVPPVKILDGQTNKALSTID